MKTLSFFLLLLFAACAGVTGTGNPCVGEECLDSEYRNETYGVTFQVPDGWELSDAQQSSGSSGGNNSHPDAASVSPEAHLVDVVDPNTGTTVEVSVRLLSQQPVSLLNYLTQNYSGQSFTAYNTGSLSGYLYDDPQSGSHSGDAKIYYFLSDRQLFIISVEQFGSTFGVNELLTSLQLQ